MLDELRRSQQAWICEVRLGVARAHRGVYVADGIEHCRRGGADYVAQHEVREKTRQHAKRSQNPHRHTHAQRRVLHAPELGVGLAEEHAVADLDEARQREHAGDDAHDGHERVAYRASGRLLKRGLVYDPLGIEAVEGRYAAYRKRAYKEERRGLRHLPGEAAKLFKVGGAGGVEHAAGREEQKPLEERVVYRVVEAAG